MIRLPTPGEDNWANILNSYLLVAHNPDGTLRADAGSVSLNDLLTTNTPQQVKTPLLSHDGTNLVWKTSIEINVRDYGAKGDGVTDDTEAIQAAIDDAGSGLVVFPSGVFMIRGIKVRNKGTAIRGDGRFGTRIKRLSGTQPLIDMSGSSSGIGHLRYDTIGNFQIDGNGMPGVLLRSYYADSCVYRELSFINCRGVALDFVEVWDSRFENCTWENCGSLDAPATLFRNSTAPGTFGYSTDNTNQIHFTGCRWETFGNGAIRLDGAANGSKTKMNGIFFVACKMETKIAAGPAFQVLNGTTVVFVNQLYLAIMGRDPRHTAPIDAIADHASHLFMMNVYIQWGTAAGLASSAVHVVKAAPHMYHDLASFYPNEAPTNATIWVDPEADDVTISSLWVNKGRTVLGNYRKMLDNNPRDGLAILLEHTGSFRLTDKNSGEDLVKADNNLTRPALHLVNGMDGVGFSDSYHNETWRIVGATGAARFARGKFQIEATKGYAGINATPFSHIALLLKIASPDDRGLVIVRSSLSAQRLMEFQDESHTTQGLAFDAYGRPIAMGTPPQVTAGEQTAYAVPDPQVRDAAGSIKVAIRPSPTTPGTIARVTFSHPYAATPLAITLTDHSAVAGDLYISSRSATSFVISTRRALRGGSILRFNYIVIA